MHRRNYFKLLKMKPVKLEMLFDDKTDNGFKSVGDNITSTKDKLKLLIEVQKSYIENIKSTLENTKKSFSASTNVEETKKLSVSIVEVEKELKDAEFALALLEKGMEESGDEAGTLRTRIMNLKNDMAKMTEGTDEYREAMQRLGEMQDRYGDITQQGRVLADDEKNIRATADAIAGLSGAMSAGVGIASLFGAEQEKLQQIQTRLQAVMATTIGLQQVAQTLNKDSYFSIVLLQGAKKKWAAAQAVLNTQLGIGVGLSKALMLSGIGVLIAGIAALIAVYGKWKKKQEEINALKQEYIDLEVDTVKAMAADKVKMEQLHKIASDQTKTLELRNKAIEKLKSIMPDYNGKINKEGELIDNANTAMKNYLVTLHKVEKAKKTFAKIEEKQGERDAAAATPPKTANRWQKTWARIVSSLDESGYLTYEGIVDDINDNYKKANDKLVSGLDEELKKLWSEIDEIAGDKTVFDALFGDETKNGASSTSIPENRLSEQRLDALRRINEKRIALMAEGEEKRKSQAKQEYENTLVEIAREKEAREKHLQELLKAKIPVSQEEVDAISAQAQQEALLAKQQYDAKIRQIDTETANQHKAIQNELRLNFETRLNQQLADTDAYYNDLLKKAKGNISLIAQIENARIQSRKQITHEAQLREIELENELALRKQEIDERQVILAADRQEKLLQIELDGQQKKLAKLEEMQRDGMEVAEDIKLVRSEIDKLSASLKRIPTDRVKEIGGHLKNWLSTLSGIGGELGESLSALADGVDGVTAAFDKEATTTDHVGNAISGLVKLYQMASAQLEENRQKQQEWNDKIEEAVHKARMLRIEELEYQQSNVFGVENPYAKAIAGANQYRQSMTELNDSLGKLAGGQIQVGTKKVVSGKNIATGAAAGATAGAAIGSVIPVIGTALGGLIGGALGGLFGATKKKVVPVFESLAQKFGSILKDGTETFELNPAILENYSKLDDATKKLVDNWEQIREKALEAQEQMRQTFSDLAGDIGGSLSDALVNSFKNGDVFGAVDAFEEKLNSKIENIISQLVFSAHFKKMFDELEERMSDSFDDGGDGDIIDDILWFSNQYKDKIAAYGEDMKAWQEEMKRQGFDLFKPEDTARSAVSKGISGLSQDQGNKLEGQLTNVQGKLMNIDKNVVDMASFLFRIFEPISRIADNTDRLAAIEDSMEEVKEGIGKMVREGINLKR